LSLAMLASLTLLCSLNLTGCATSNQPKVIVIPADRATVRMEANQPYTPAWPGWFVPDARMLELMTALEQKRFEGEKK
jgi:hypothetical protein